VWMNSRDLRSTPHGPGFNLSFLGRPSSLWPSGPECLHCGPYPLHACMPQLWPCLGRLGSRETYGTTGGSHRSDKAASRFGGYRA